MWVGRKGDINPLFSIISVLGKKIVVTQSDYDIMLLFVKGLVQLFERGLRWKSQKAKIKGNFVE